MSDIIVGRFQPFHLGHVKIIESMDDPIIAIVKGSKTSANTDKNPLSEQEQIRLIRKVFPNIKIVIAKSGYVPDILDEVSSIERVFCGEDRIKDYTRQINTSKNDYSVQLIETERFCSATAVREAIRNNDIDAYKKMMPESLHPEFDSLKGKIAI